MNLLFQNLIANAYKMLNFEGNTFWYQSTWMMHCLSTLSLRYLQLDIYNEILIKT